MEFQGSRAGQRRAVSTAGVFLLQAATADTCRAQQPPTHDAIRMARLAMPPKLADPLTRSGALTVPCLQPGYLYGERRWGAQLEFAVSGKAASFSRAGSAPFYRCGRNGTADLRGQNHRCVDVAWDDVPTLPDLWAATLDDTAAPSSLHRDLCGRFAAHAAAVTNPPSQRQSSHPRY